MAFVLASNNPGKLREFEQLFTKLGLEVVPQAQFGVEDADETGLSFIENALIKRAMRQNEQTNPLWQMTPELLFRPSKERPASTLRAIQVKATQLTMKNCSGHSRV